MPVTALSSTSRSSRAWSAPRSRALATTLTSPSCTSPVRTSLEETAADLVELVPDRNEIAAACTCPDAAPSGGASCKHVLATLLVLADELTIDPDLLTRWRSAAARPLPDARPEPADDLLTGMLTAPAPAPTPPTLPPRLPVAMPATAGEFAAVLADALSVLRGLPV